jgi:hypothetical protein
LRIGIPEERVRGSDRCLAACKLIAGMFDPGVAVCDLAVVNGLGRLFGGLFGRQFRGEGDSRVVGVGGDLISG